MILIALGAYGREANLKDWEDGKDFRDHDANFREYDTQTGYVKDGTYFSKRDVGYLKSLGFKSIEFYAGQPLSVKFIVQL